MCVQKDSPVQCESSAIRDEILSAMGGAAERRRANTLLALFESQCRMEVVHASRRIGELQRSAGSDSGAALEEAERQLAALQALLDERDLELAARRERRDRVRVSVRDWREKKTAALSLGNQLDILKRATREEERLLSSESGDGGVDQPIRRDCQRRRARWTSWRMR